MELPALSSDELGLLRESIRQHGVINPVLLDRGGAVIDGANRQRIAAELNIECPTRTLDLDREQAERLKLELQLGRRNLDRDVRDRFVAALRKTGLTQQAIADVTGIPQRTVSDILNSGSANETIPEVVNKRGQKRPAQYATKKTAPVHVIREREQDRERTERYREIREADQQSQLNSMRNAPAGSLNLPGLRRAREIRKLLRELSSLDPERFLTQIPTEACREFDPEVARWWLGFCELAAQHTNGHRPVTLTNGKPAGSESRTTREQKILDALRERGPMTSSDLADWLGCSQGSITGAATALTRRGLLGVQILPGSARTHVYRATVPDPDLKEGDAA
jgi:ParB-like chromosome segregation protein Spo0J